MAFELYRADYPGAPSYFSGIDLRAAFFRKYSGLAAGSLNDHMYAFFKRESGSALDLTLNDYMRLFFNTLGISGMRKWESGTYATTTVRTNLSNNPSLANDVVGWTGAAASLAYNSGAGVTAPGFGRLNQTASATAIAATGTGVAALGAQVYTASCSVRSTVARNASARLAFNGGGIAVGTPATTGGATWFRVFSTAAVPGPDTGVRADVSIASGGTAGDLVDFDDVLLELAPTMGTFFDGNTPSTLTKKYAWLGTANASSSTETTKAWSP